ncbi:diguanylate cyclase [Geobacter sp. SVR]|uniref:diguanylate cyclase n=1 Tax=Geobacter sp. SVR TaxID=2495594 RepID=UPI00143EFBD9|nr:diguanylate cyclase [Geobacter sp. SVR]BCS54218.1 hypothetical protein GSVR_25260 [Geobacter sp. SVR]GCF85924.1 hypothetical protein GSbR_25240 [Geobacter sp. SVR]
MLNRRQKLLIIDDTPVNIEILGELMGGECEVLFALNGTDGIELACSQLPDLILLDVMMPDVDGYEVCSRLKQDPLTRSIPVIFVTAMNHEEDEARGLEIGAIDYVNKPINQAIVRARIRNHLELKRHRDLLENICLADGLTGVANRRRFDQYLDQEWRRALRSGTTISLVMIDIDYFKLFNDGYGHVAGDECLRKVALKLVETLKRPSDMAARYGGEEFACILPETDAAGALLVAEELRHEVEALQIPHESSEVSSRVTISVGVASMTPSPGESYVAIAEQADQALYAAKKEGRNRVSSCRLDLQRETFRYNGSNFSAGLALS